MGKKIYEFRFSQRAVAKNIYQLYVDHHEAGNPTNKTIILDKSFTINKPQDIAFSTPELADTSLRLHPNGVFEIVELPASLKSCTFRIDKPENIKINGKLDLDEFLLYFSNDGTLETNIINRGNVFLHRFVYNSDAPVNYPPTTIKGKIESLERFVSITALHLVVQNKITAKKGTSLYVDQLSYGADDLATSGKLEILFRQSAKIDTPLNTIGDISIHSGNSNISDTLEITQPIKSELGEVRVRAAKLQLKNKLIGQRRHIIVLDEFEYDPAELYDTSPLRITCNKGGDVLKKTIYNGADIHIDVPANAALPFNILHPITAGYKPADATHEPGPANVLLEINNGGMNKGLTQSPLIKSETGNIELKLAEIDMLALQCEAKHDVALEILPVWNQLSEATHGKFNLGNLTQPNKVSLRAGGNCFFKQTGIITTQAIELTANHDLVVDATTEWTNRTSKIKLGGTAHLRTPSSSHTLVSPQDFSAQRLEAMGKTTLSFTQSGEIPFSINAMQDILVKTDMKKDLTVKQPIHSQEGQVHLSACNLAIQNKISAKKARIFRMADIQYETDYLYDRSLLALHFVTGGKIRSPLLNLGPIFIRSSLGAAPLTIENNIIAGYSKDPATTPAPGLAHLNIYAITHMPIIKRAIPAPEGMQAPILASHTGDVIFAAPNIQYDAFIMTAAKLLRLVSEQDITLGNIDNPNETPVLRSAQNCELTCKNNLNTYYMHGQFKNNFHVTAPGKWDDVANQIFVGGRTKLTTPLSDHRLLTKVTQTGEVLPSHQGRFSRVFNFNARMIKTEAVSSAPFFMTSALENTGEINVFGGFFYFLKHISGPIPVATSFTETHVNYFTYRDGHDEYRKCKDRSEGPHAEDRRIFPAAVGMNQNEYKQNEITITGNVRAGELTLAEFDHCTIGLSAPKKQTCIIQTRTFQQVVDVTAETQVPLSTLVQSTDPTSYSVLVDILELSPKRPILPRIIVTPTGFRMAAADEQSLHPFSIEAQRVAMTFLTQIGTLPPEIKLTQLDLEMIHGELMQAALTWTQGPVQAQGSTPLLHNNELVLLKNACTTIEQPMLFFVKREMQLKNGTMKSILPPIIVFPRSYEKLFLNTYNSVIADLLKILGKNGAQLQIFCKTHGNKLVEVDVDTLTVETKTYTERRTIEHNETKKRLGRSRTRTTHETVEIITAAETASLTSSDRLNVKAQDMHQIGAVVGAPDGHINAKNYVERPMVTTHLESYTDAEKTYSGLKKLSIEGQYVQTTLHPSRLIGANLLLTGDTADIQAVELTTGSAKISFTQKIYLHPYKITQFIPPKISKRRGMFTVGVGSVDKIIPNHLLALTHALLISTEGPYHSIATLYVAKNLIQIIAREINEMAAMGTLSYQSKTTGMQGFSYVHERHQLTQEIPHVPTFSTTALQGAVEITATGGDSTLQAPCVHTHTLKIKAENGDVNILALPVQMQLLISQNTVGFSFFGTKCLEACMTGHYRLAFVALLKEFPLLCSLGNLSKAKDLADVGIHGLESAYYWLALYKDYLKAENWMEFLKGQIPLHPSLRFGHSASEHTRNDPKVATIKLSDLDITARNILIEGAKVWFEKSMTLIADEMIMIKSAQSTESTKKHASGVSVGIDLKTMVANVDVDQSKSNSGTMQHKPANFQGPDAQFTALGKHIKINGAIVSVKRVILEADTIVMATMQDKVYSREKAWSLSTSMSGNLSVGGSKEQWASDQTKIIASETLIIKAKKMLKLSGSNITVGAQALPYAAHFNGEDLVFYKHELPDSLKDDGAILALGLFFETDINDNSIAALALEYQLNIHLWREEADRELIFVAEHQYDAQGKIINLCQSNGVIYLLTHTPGYVAALEMYFEDLLDVVKTKKLQIRFQLGAKSVLPSFSSDPEVQQAIKDQNSKKSGYIVPEFRTRSETQVNVASFDGAFEFDSLTAENLIPRNRTGNRNILVRKHHYGMFIPLATPAEIIEDIKQTLQREAKMNTQQNSLSVQQQDLSEKLKTDNSDARVSLQKEQVNHNMDDIILLESPETSFHRLIGIFSGQIPVKIKYLYRGAEQKPKKTFSKGFKSSGKNLDLMCHLDPWDVGNGVNDSAYISTSKSKKAASQFPHVLEKPPAYLYKINPQSNGLDIEKTLNYELSCGRKIDLEDLNNWKAEKERAVRYKINHHDIKGAWELTGNIGEGETRVIGDTFIPNPNYVPPMVLRVAQGLKYFGYVGTGVAAAIDSFSLYKAYEYSSYTGLYAPVFKEITRITAAWNAAIILGFEGAKWGGGMCLPMGPWGSLACGFLAGAASSYAGYTGASGIVNFATREEQLINQTIDPVDTEAFDREFLMRRSVPQQKNSRLTLLYDIRTSRNNSDTNTSLSSEEHIKLSFDKLLFN